MPTFANGDESEIVSRLAQRDRGRAALAEALEHQHPPRLGTGLE